MVDLFANGLEWLRQQMRDHLSTEITYTPVNASGVTVSATLGRSDREVINDLGLVERYEARDFIISPASISGLPQVGDTISHNGQTYKVLPMGDEPHYIFTDPYETQIRVHTKRVS